jgi:hypothetical protein
MPIVPDEKDWTWVLDRPCPECGFDASALDPADVAALVRANLAEWGPLLTAGPATTRPDDATWSALEYACHVRDVFELYERRLGWLLEQDDPTFPNWDQDETAVTSRYAEQDPLAVVAELEAAGASIADAFDRVPGDAWGRTGARSDGARFTVDTFARYFVHDPIHHVWDVERGYEALAAGR